MASTFRPDIEGLRGVAVLLVLFFHAGFSAFEGGFVGVDIFFVISGFLITGLLKFQIENQTFSFSAFYHRRIRRLFPASMVTIVSTLLVASWMFGSQDLKSVSGEAFYSIAALSNFYFWVTTNYFDDFASLKPLLHTWSLGVEEQFYLFWPAFILVLSKAKRPVLPLGILLIGGISLAASEAMVSAHPAAAFFLTPFRLFEFAIGAGLVFVRTTPNPWLGKALFAIGLGLVGYAAFAFSERVPFPGVNGLVPTIGAALMIFGGACGGLALILTNKAMRWVGRISYSLYLVHWPVTAFITYRSVGDLTLPLQILVLALSFGFALPLYYFVENRFRDPSIKKLSPAGFSLSCAISALVGIVVFATCWAHDGWSWRLPTWKRVANNVTEVETTDYVAGHFRKYFNQPFDQNKVKLLVLGDSMSAGFINMLHEHNLQHRFSIHTRNISQYCGVLYIPPERAEDFYEKENDHTADDREFRSSCKRQHHGAFGLDKIQQADVIILANHWKAWSPPYIKGTVEYLEKESGVPVFVLGRKDLSKSSIQLVNMYGRSQKGLEKFAAAYRSRETTKVNQSFSSQLGERYISLIDITCPRTEWCGVVNDVGQPLFWDAAHLTPAGAKIFGAALIESGFIERLQKSNIKQLKSAVTVYKSVCDPDIFYVAPADWHKCERRGARWLKALSAELEIVVPDGATKLIMRGSHFGEKRVARIFIDGRKAYQGVIPSTALKLDLGEVPSIGLVTVRLEFDGPPPMSPKILNGTTDARILNFHLTEFRIER